MELLVSIAGVLKTVLSLVIVLTMIVLVHELGHYIAARLMGVRVETFSFGFGKRLFGKQMGDTDFRVSLIPFGGYIKMAGDEEWDPDNLKPDEFQAKNRAQKIFILFMGPAMNLLLAFAIFVVINISGVEMEAFKNEPPRIGYVMKGSPAEAVGILKGDLVRSIDGSSVPDWKSLEIKIGSNANQKLQLVIERNGLLLKKQIKVNSITKQNLGDAGLEWEYKTKITSVTENSPALKAGLKTDDIVLEIDGKPVNSFEFSDRIAQSQGRSLPIKVKRSAGGRDIEKVLQVTPMRIIVMESAPLGSLDDVEAIMEKTMKAFPKSSYPKLSFSLYQPDAKYRITSQSIDSPEEMEKYLAQARAKGIPFNAGERWMVGISHTQYAPTIKINYSLFPAMGKAITDIVNLTGLVFDAFRKIIVGKLSPKNLSGPIEIAKVSGKAMESGASNFFLLIAFISLQLGIVNLFPIPALDGGYLMIFSLEAILRREFSQKVKSVLMNIGIVFLIGLMAFVILNDIAKTLPNGWNSFWPF